MIPCLRTNGGKPLWSMGHLDAFRLPLCPISSHFLLPRRVKALGGLQEENVCPQVLEACASPPFSPAQHVLQLLPSVEWPSLRILHSLQMGPARNSQSLWLSWELGQRKVLRLQPQENGGRSLVSTSLQAEMPRDWEKRCWAWSEKNLNKREKRQ